MSEKKLLLKNAQIQERLDPDLKELYYEILGTSGMDELMKKFHLITQLAMIQELREIHRTDTDLNRSQRYAKFNQDKI